jgi:hypothetical protein
LNPNGSEDLQLKIQDLPNITVGEWRLSDEDTVTVNNQTPPIPAADLDFQNPIAPFAMELRTRHPPTWNDLYYTYKEIEEGISDMEEDESDAPNSEDDAEGEFNDDEDFDSKYSIEDAKDMNIRD